MPAHKQLSAEATRDHSITQILLSQTSVKDIKVSVKKTFWPNASNLADLPDIVPGKITRWTNKSTLSVQMEWPDGTETEHLCEILVPEFDFKLTANANGGPPPRLRTAPGAAPQPQPADQNLPGVDVPYKVGSNEYVQNWKETGDWAQEQRPGTRYRASIKACDPVITKTPEAMFLRVAFPPPVRGKMLKFLNARLSGVTTKKDPYTNAFCTEGELVLWIGITLQRCLNPQLDEPELWSQTPDPDRAGPPFNIGRYGMARNRYRHLKSLIWQYWEVDESDLEAGNPFRYLMNLEKDSNAWYAEAITPSWILNMDESMSWYEGAVGDPDTFTPSNPKLLPHLDHVPRKPRPIGKEIKCIADGDSGLIIRTEFQRGKHLHAKQQYYDEYLSRGGRTKKSTHKRPTHKFPAPPWKPTSLRIEGG